MNRRALLVLAKVAMFGAACSGGGSEPVRTPDSDGNLLINPGFETGEEPWQTLHPETGFAVTSEQPHSGSSSFVLQMRDPASSEGLQIYEVSQEFTVERLPEIVSAGITRAIGFRTHLANTSRSRS